MKPELRIVKEYPNQEIRCPVHLSIGQEAPAVAVNIFLKNDFAISYHRSHAHYIAKDGDLKKMVSEIYGKESGCSSGAGGSMHLIDLKKIFRQYSNCLKFNSSRGWLCIFTKIF